MLSRTGRLNAAAAGVWAGLFADRALLLLTVPWIVLRAYIRETRLLERPAGLYEPGTWLSALLQSEMPGAVAWYGVAAVMVACVWVCWRFPQVVLARLVLAFGARYLIAPEFAYGKVDHMNHVFLLGHVLALFLPVGTPNLQAALRDRGAAEATLRAQARAFDWYRAGLLFPYTLAGFWKVLDLTVRAVLKPGMTFLHPDALLITSATTYRSHDLPLEVPRSLATFNEVFGPGYIALAVVFLAASTAGFRRPLLGLMLPVILLFHLSNILTLYVIFATTCVVVIALLFPYDRAIPAVRRSLVPVEIATFTGRGWHARYVRHYANGDADEFDGFRAYRARWTDASWWLGGPLHHPLFDTVMYLVRYVGTRRRTATQL